MDKQASNEHRFKQDSGMTFEEVYGFTLGFFIPILENLAAALDRPDFVELLQSASSDAAAQNTEKMAENLPACDFEAWTEHMREPSRRWQHVLATDVVEDTETAFEIKVTECLWAKTFQEADAAEMGYALICHPDYATCQAFNPKIRMIRSKTLMQGDDYCNHRWVWEE